MNPEKDQEAAQGVPTFDPVTWLRSFTDAGGGYAVSADRRLLFGMASHAMDVPRLLSHLEAIQLHPERREAIRHLIECRQNGEAS